METNKDEIRILKKKLSKLKYCQRSLPRLIDCSNVYGDNFFTNEDLVTVEKEIEETENKIHIIKNTNQ